MSRCGGLKFMDGNYIYQLDRQYGDKTHWKCERRQYKARPHVYFLC